MTYSMRLVLMLPVLLSAKIPGQQSEQESLQDHLQTAWQQLHDLVEEFRSAPITPESTFRFEQKLQLHLREVGRLTLQHTFNSLEPDEVSSLPAHVRFEGTAYTRINRKTPQQVWSLFGHL